jgi:hypothetical protein
MDAQYFLIGTDGRHYGPLSVTDVRTWLTDGRASRYSRARRDSEAQWMPLREMPEFEEETRPPYAGGGTAGGSADTSGPEDLTGPPAAELRADGTARLDPILCFRFAWALVTRDFFTLGGWTLLAVITISAITLIPRVGVVVGVLVNNLLWSGLYVLYLRRIRGHGTRLDDVTEAVRPVAARIILAGLVQPLLTAPLLIAARDATAANTAASLAMLVAIFIPCVYLIVGYIFVLPLIVDRHMTVWQAMETSRRAVHRQWFQTLGLLLAAGMLLIIAAAALGFGLVLAFPLSIGALMVGYEEMFSR